MRIRGSRTLGVAAIATILLLALIFVVPAAIRVDRYRPRVISYLEQKTGKEIEMGRLALTFFPLKIHVDHFGVRNPPLFPPGYVVQVAQIDAELSVRALLHRQIVIESLVLEEPVVNLTSDPDGPWNFENPQAEVSANDTPLGPIASVKVKRGVASMDGHGSLSAGILRFGSVEVRSLDSKLRLESRHVFFADVKADVYGGTALGELSFDLSNRNTSFKTNARMHGINLAQLLAAFPNGRGKMTGKMEGDLRLEGEIAHSIRPFAGMHGTGRLTVRNGQVPSLKLNANLMKLAHFNDLGPAKNDPSSFNLITSDLELANQRISSKVIDIDGYGVDVDGSGSVSVSGSDELNYRGLAEITTKEGFFTNTVARLSGASLKDGKLQFPFRIGGTIDSPIFSKGKGDKDVDAVPNHR